MNCVLDEVQLSYAWLRMGVLVLVGVIPTGDLAAGDLFTARSCGGLTKIRFGIDTEKRVDGTCACYLFLVRDEEVGLARTRGEG